MSKATSASKSNGSHKKKGTESSPSSSAAEFSGGQTVQWKLRGRIHTGQLVTELTEPTHIEGHFVSASAKEPKWLVDEQMDDPKTKHLIALAPSALFREGALQAKEKSAAAATKEAEQPTETKVKAKDDKSVKSVKVSAAAATKSKESGGATKEAEEKKETATPAAAAAAKPTPKIATKVTGV